MDKKQLENSWNNVKQQVSQQWDKLTGQELENIQGKYEHLSSSLQKHYNYTKEEADKKINEFLNKMN